MQEAPTSLMEMFEKATANPNNPIQRFELFIQLLDYLSSAFPLMPSPRKNDADALADHCAAEINKLTAYKVFHGCYHHLLLGTKTNNRGVGILMDTKTHPIAAIYLTLHLIHKYPTDKDMHKKNLKICENTLNEFGKLATAISRYLWGLYYYKCAQNYDKAASHFNKAKEYPVTWFTAGEMYFTLTSSNVKNPEVYHQLAKQYLTQYLTSATYITQPTAFVMLGELYEREKDYVGAARFYCLGKVCGLDAANQAYQRLRDNDAANKIAIQTWGACQTILDETNGQVVTLLDFCQTLDKRLSAFESFSAYYATRGGLFTPANAAASSTPGEPGISSSTTFDDSADQHKSEKCLMM